MSPWRCAREAQRFPRVDMKSSLLCASARMSFTRCEKWDFLRLGVQHVPACASASNPLANGCSQMSHVTLDTDSAGGGTRGGVSGREGGRGEEEEELKP